MMKEIQKNCDYRFTLGDLAEKYHISEAYFSNLFTKTAGVGLMNYIMMIRVDKAKSLLLQTDYRINDIALLSVMKIPAILQRCSEKLQENRLQTIGFGREEKWKESKLWENMKPVFIGKWLSRLQ